MKGYDMYCEIKQMKEKGFSLRQTAKRLGIHRATVKRYWEMDADEFEESSCRTSRQYKLDFMQETILGWLKENEGMSSAQVCDWLKEHYGDEYSERTVSRYVRRLREEYGIPKASSEPRVYEAMEDPPMGKQMQADMGKKWMSTPSGGRIKVYFASYVLSHSRYKYVCFRHKPFTASDFVIATKRSFAYFEGMPEEIVMDQDSLISVDENYGDIIFTYEYERFRQEYGFSVYLCRKSDPESKGRIENVVGYVKNNFLAYRNYPGEDEYLDDMVESWLDRTANAKDHGTTKKSPKEVWLIERNHLRPLPKDMIPGNEPMVYRTVRKDNTIIYGSNRYSVPHWIYGSGCDVLVEETDGGKLVISTPNAGIICEHTLLVGKGGLRKNADHSRDKEKSIDLLQESLSDLLMNEADDFLSRIRKEKRRYARDQFGLIRKIITAYGKEQTMEGIGYCMINNVFSATFLRDYMESRLPGCTQETDTCPEKNLPAVKIPRADQKFHVMTEKRAIAEYTDIGGAI